jgi:hypothetical protein
MVGILRESWQILPPVWTPDEVPVQPDGGAATLTLPAECGTIHACASC